MGEIVLLLWIRFCNWRWDRANAAMDRWERWHNAARMKLRKMKGF